MIRKTLKHAFRDAQAHTGHAFRLATAAFRPLPSVLIVGAQKAGTTTLFKELSRSPTVRASVLKEVHFFDIEYNRGPWYYRSWFPTGGGSVVLDCTPSYMLYLEVASKIKALVPQTKIVAILRDPAERAWSHYRHHLSRDCRVGSEREFEACIERDIRDWQEEGLPQSWTAENRLTTYVRRGLYVDQLVPYFDLFRGRVMVLQAEKLYEDPQPELDRVSAFLEVTPPRASHRARNVGKALSWKPDLSRLKDFFAPHNERLYRLLDVEPWWPY